MPNEFRIALFTVFRAFTAQLPICEILLLLLQLVNFFCVYFVLDIKLNKWVHVFSTISILEHRIRCYLPTQFPNVKSLSAWKSTWTIYWFSVNIFHLLISYRNKFVFLKSYYAIVISLSFRFIHVIGFVIHAILSVFDINWFSFLSWSKC